MHFVQNIPVQYSPHVFDISLVNPGETVQVAIAQLISFVVLNIAVKTTRAFNSHPRNFVIQQQAKVTSFPDDSSIYLTRTRSGTS
jgi:hypothetical protein